jgi:hypothetical protein
VRSPLLLHVFLTPAQSEKELDLEYQVTLYTEDGSILIKQEINQDENNEVSPHQVLEIEFDIPRSAQSTRLEISSRDKFGRLTAITTTDLVLLSRGEEEIKAIQDLYASLLVQQPIPSTLIQGDILVIQGVTRFSADDQLVVELVNRDGGQVGSGTVTISEETLGFGYRSFEGEIPFQVGTTSWIQVQVYARDGNFSGVQYLTSVEVLVSP